MTTERPAALNPYQAHVLGRMDELSNQIADVRTEVGRLQGRARAWGAVPGAIAIMVSIAALLLGIK